MITFSWVSNRANFLLRPTEDGLAFETHSDLVARVTTDTLDKRIVVPAKEVAFIKVPRPSRARAEALEHRIYSLPVSPKIKDDIFLAALAADGYPHLRRLKAVFRITGYMKHLWNYNKHGR